MQIPPNNKKNIDNLINKAIGDLRNNYIVIGKNRVRVWQFWLFVGLIAGFSTAIVIVANRTGQFETSVAANTITVTPAADAYVRAGTYKDKNFGGASVLRIEDAVTAADKRRAFLRFNLTSVAIPSTINKAVLRLRVNNLSASGNLPAPFIVKKVASDAWTEKGITWNNKPSLGSTLFGFSAEAVPADSQAYFEADVTSYVVAQFAGDKQVSFGLLDNTEAGKLIKFSSRETAYKPQLLITYGDSPPPPPPSVVDYVVEGLVTSPGNITAGTSVSFSATIRNQGSAAASVSSATRLRLDVNNDSTYDLTLSNMTTGALATGATEVETWSNAWTAVAGTHKFEICADQANAIVESNESNNCAAQTFTVSSSTSTVSISPFGSVTVSSNFELNGNGTNIDTPAFWEASNSSDSLLFVSAKDNNLVEVWKYPFQGNQLASINPGHAVNGLTVDQVRGELYVMGGGNVSVYSLPAISKVRSFGGIPTGENNGEILHVTDGQTRLYVSSNNAVHVFDAISGTKLSFTITPPVSSIEVVLADDFYQNVHVPEEQGVKGISPGIHVYKVDGTVYNNGGDNKYGETGVFNSDEEGMAVYKCLSGGSDTGLGWYMVSDQISTGTEFEFFNRQSWEYLGKVKVNGVALTDGIASTQQATTNFPMGVFAAVDNDTTTAVIDWRTILNATGLSCGNGVAPPSPPPPPPPPPTPPPPPPSPPSTSPDYIAEGLASSPGNITAGTSVSFSVTIRNQGSAAASVSSATRLRLDVNNDSTYDLTLSNMTTGALATGATEVETWSNAWTAVAGTHKFEICADQANAIVESNESNNCAAQTFTVSDTAPPPPPPSSSGVVGYGANTVGGTGGTTTTVTSLAVLKTCVAGTSKRICKLSGSGVWDLGGQGLKINRPNITIDGSAANIVFKRGSINIETNQVILRHIRSRSGDEAPVNGQDVDSITINGNTAARDHIVLDHVEGIWGPDVSGVILGRVTDVTIQYSIFGEGLFHSSHLESRDADGHSLTFNIASEDPNNAAERITLYGNLFTTSQSRQPRIIGCSACDIIDSVFYNYAEGPQGNPQSLNIIGSTWKKGPAPAAAGIPFTNILWRYQPGGHGAFGSRFDQRVYIGDSRVVGFTSASPSGDDAAVLRSSPMVTPSVASIGSVAAYDMVLSQAGSQPHDAITQRLIDNLRNDTGVYVNGDGYPPPNPSW